MAELISDLYPNWAEYKGDRDWTVINGGNISLCLLTEPAEGRGRWEDPVGLEREMMPSTCRYPETLDSDSSRSNPVVI